MPQPRRKLWWCGRGICVCEGDSSQKQGKGVKDSGGHVFFKLRKNH